MRRWWYCNRYIFFFTYDGEEFAVLNIDISFLNNCYKVSRNIKEITIIIHKKEHDSINSNNEGAIFKDNKIDNHVVQKSPNNKNNQKNKKQEQ